MNSMKNNWLELSVGNLAFDEIVRIFGKDQQMIIDKLYLFEYNKKGIGDNEYNEDFFYGVYLTLEMFLRFLQSINHYEILGLVFELEDGTLFHIDDGMATISIHQKDEEYLLKALSQLKSEYFAPFYQNTFEKSISHRFIKKTSEIQLIENREFFDQFELCSN